MHINYLSISLVAFLMSACTQKNTTSTQETADSVTLTGNKEVSNRADMQEITATDTSIDQGKQWLENIFKTKNSDRYFPDYNVEEKLCTKQFQEFIADSGELYSASNLTDEEYPAAEKRYKDKWSKIYPIEEREMWLFGRGNGDIGELQKLEISKLKDHIYRVFIDYGEGIKTQNEVSLVLEKGHYKIDYCKTEFID
ncbi:hypothetical protein [Sphingobacterium paucimobilis]|uniref:Uncharacterized protein n=1 Tax=Sphingobacterium paucimobilis HER1398 TaxID=1346330 RepID=U2HU23_9SPHI|nr:hypothetical protein [Sphingobacterium paucimobilis]ERJ58780.1 hypothetical protein M472_08365 [Sphingobacterium paucimobilis HER1398]